jgi:propane monooxygenase large subunit
MRSREPTNGRSFDPVTKAKMPKPMQRSKEKEMTAGLTLNKITAQKGISIAEAASRVADLGWTPSYVQEAMTFPTDYKISKTPRDPMKQVLRSYFPMQEEKDNRVYGALDAALRGDMFRNVEPRWVEWM